LLSKGINEAHYLCQNRSIFLHFYLTGNAMAGVNKTQLTETDIVTKFILPAVKKAGWDDMTQIRQEVKLRDG